MNDVHVPKSNFVIFRGIRKIFYPSLKEVMSQSDLTRVHCNLKYATSFEEKILGSTCDVEVVVDIVSGQTQATIGMRSFLRASPVFSISIEDLVDLGKALQKLQSQAKLLTGLLAGASEHQLNFSAGGATLIVVHPKNKDPRFSLAVGSFSREGSLKELPEKEINDAVLRVQGLMAQVTGKVASNR